MYDDLSRIEASYGCVPEYYRVMEEEREVEMTDKEAEKLRAEVESWNRRLKILNGIPSDFVMALKAEWDQKKPVSSGNWTMSDVYAWQDYNREKLHDIGKRLCGHYGLMKKMDKPFYKDLKPGQFSIGVEYTKNCMVLTWSVCGLNYEQFKPLFRDLCAAGFSPAMKYCDKAGRIHIRSNSSLGSLRACDFVQFGSQLLLTKVRSLWVLSQPQLTQIHPTY